MFVCVCVFTFVPLSILVCFCPCVPLKQFPCTFYLILFSVDSVGRFLVPFTHPLHLVVYVSFSFIIFVLVNVRSFDSQNNYNEATAMLNFGNVFCSHS